MASLLGGLGVILDDTLHAVGNLVSGLGDDVDGALHTVGGLITVLGSDIGGLLGGLGTGGAASPAGSAAFGKLLSPFSSHSTVVSDFAHAPSKTEAAAVAHPATSVSHLVLADGSHIELKNFVAPTKH